MHSTSIYIVAIKYLPIISSLSKQETSHKLIQSMIG